MRFFAATIIVISGLMLLQSAPAHAQDPITVAQVLEKPVKFINRVVTLQGVPKEFAKSDRAPRWKSMYLLNDPDAPGTAIRVYTNGPELDDRQVTTVTGIVRPDLNNRPFLEEGGSGINPLLIVLLVALIIAAGMFLYLLLKKPTPLQVPTVACVNPACGKQIQATNTECPFCGANQAGARVIVPPKPPSPILEPADDAKSATQVDIAVPAPTILETLVGNLYVTEGDLKGKLFPVGGHAVTFGRAPNCTVVLDAPNVSREHAEIRVEGEGVVIEDKQSTNGTFVNGTRITQHTLVDRDEIRIGAVTMLYEKR